MFNLIGIYLQPNLDVDQNEVLRLVLSLESARQSQEDLVAQAISRVAKSNQIKPSPVTFFKEIPGMEIGGIIDNRAVIFGSLQFMEASSLECSHGLTREAKIQEALGRKVLYLGWEAQVRAIFVFETKK